MRILVVEDEAKAARALARARRVRDPEDAAILRIAGASPHADGKGYRRALPDLDPGLMRVVLPALARPRQIDPFGSEPEKLLGKFEVIIEPVPQSRRTG